MVDTIDEKIYKRQILKESLSRLTVMKIVTTFEIYLLSFQAFVRFKAYCTSIHGLR
jgi:hypothetical protein